MSTSTRTIPDILTTVYAYDHHRIEGWIDVNPFIPIGSDWAVTGAKAAYNDAFLQLSVEPCGRRIRFLTNPSVTLWQDTSTVEVVLLSLRDSKSGMTIEGRAIVHCLGLFTIEPRLAHVKILDRPARLVSVDLATMFHDLSNVVVLEVGAMDPRFFKLVEFDTESDAKLNFHLNPELCIGAGGSETWVDVVIEADNHDGRASVKNTLRFFWAVADPD